VIQAAGAPAALAGGCRTAVGRIDGRAQSSGFRAIADRLDEATVQERFTARLAGFFGAFALTLSGLGLFGLMSFAVCRRTREIGIRMALGAPRGEILRLVVREGVLLWLFGCGLGLVGTLVLGRLIEELLFGVPANDPATYALAAGLSLLIAVLACLRPACRATRVDPAVTLRAE
jgi:ABC-type antimicrobial peptide transport system permease subunit